MVALLDTPDAQYEQLVKQFDNAVARLFTNPDIETIQLNDPRFLWVRIQEPELPKTAETLADMANWLRTSNVFELPHAIERIDHLVEFTSDLAGASLEAELAGIVSPLRRKDQDRVEPLLIRLGWHGDSGQTLAAVSATLDISRERMRQIEEHLLSAIAERQVWTPVLDRVLNVLARNAPLSVSMAGSLLHHWKLAESAEFDITGILKAQDVFRKPRKLEIITRLNHDFLVVPGDTRTDAVLDTIASIRASAVSLVSNQGIATIGEILEDQHLRDTTITEQQIRFAVQISNTLSILENDWVVNIDPEVRNPLYNRLAKLLAVYPGVPIGIALKQLLRDADQGRGYFLEEQTLRVFVHHWPSISLQNDCILPGTSIEPSVVLGEGEHKIWVYIKQVARPCTAPELVTALEQPGLSRIAIYKWLSHSVVIQRHGNRGSYRFSALAAPVNPASSRDRHALSSDLTFQSPLSNTTHQPLLPLAKPVVPEASESEDFDASEIDNDLEDDSDEDMMDIDADGDLSSEIATETHTLIQKQGIATIEEILEELQWLDPGLDAPQIQATLQHSDDFTLLDDDRVILRDRSLPNPLYLRLAKMLAVYPDIPIGFALQQLHREAEYGGYAPNEQTLRMFARSWPTLALQHGVIASTVSLLPVVVLNEGEHSIWAWLRVQDRPCSQIEIIDAMQGSELTRSSILLWLSQSLVIVRSGENTLYRYAALINGELSQSNVEPVSPQEAVLSIDEATEAAIPPEPDGTPQTNPESPATITAEDSEITVPEREIAESTTVFDPLRPATPQPDPEPEPEPESKPFLLTSNNELAEIEDEPEDTFHDARDRNLDAIGTTDARIVTLNELLGQLDRRELMIPEIQRDYVWKPPQVRDLFDSLYRGFPIGTLLISRSLSAIRARGAGEHEFIITDVPTGHLLDGQQRLTSLRRVISTGEHILMFNPVIEQFASASATIARSPAYVSVKDVIDLGVDAILNRPYFINHPERARLRERLQRVANLGERQIHVDLLDGFTYEQVTELFIRVNSRGTRLKGTELAIAKLAMQLPGMVSDQMQGYADELEERGWQIDVQTLLGMLTAVATGRGGASYLGAVRGDSIETAWQQVRRATNMWLNMLDRSLMIRPMQSTIGVNNHVVPVVWIASNPAAIREEQLREWFVHSVIWGRYSGASATALNQDLKDLKSFPRDPFRPLMNRIRIGRSTLRITQRDLEGTRIVSGMALLAWLTAIDNDAHDLATGERLRSLILAPHARALTMPIFAKASLGTAGTATALNEIANHCFAVSAASSRSEAREVRTLLPELTPEQLQSHSLPIIETAISTPRDAIGYLAERRKLLITDMNKELERLSRS